MCHWTQKLSWSVTFAAVCRHVAPASHQHGVQTIKTSFLSRSENGQPTGHACPFRSKCLQLQRPCVCFIMVTRVLVLGVAQSDGGLCITIQVKQMAAVAQKAGFHHSVAGNERSVINKLQKCTCHKKMIQQQQRAFTFLPMPLQQLVVL